MHLAIKSFALVLGTFSYTSLPALSAPDAGQIKKANVLFERSITRFKMWKSFEFRAQERIDYFDNSFKQSRYYGGLQNTAETTRAFLLWQERESNGQYDSVSAAQLLGYHSFSQKGLAVDDPKWGTFLIPNITKRKEFAQQILALNPALFLSIWSLGGGYNPLKAPMISSVIVAREGGLDTVIIERQEEKTAIPLELKYAFQPVTGDLEGFSILRTVAGRKNRVTLKFSGLKSNWHDSQPATDSAVYTWKYFAPTWLEKPGH